MREKRDMYVAEATQKCKRIKHKWRYWDVTNGGAKIDNDTASDGKEIDKNQPKQEKKIK